MATKFKKFYRFPATEDYTLYFDVSGNISTNLFYNELEIKIKFRYSQILFTERITRI